MRRADEPVSGGMYNNLIHAYAERHMPEKTEAILHLMWHDYKSGNKVLQQSCRLTVGRCLSTLNIYNRYEVRVVH